MQSIMIPLPEDADLLLQTLLLAAARFEPAVHDRHGFHVEVGDGLKGPLSFFDRHEGAALPEVTVTRLYANFAGERPLANIVSDRAEEFFNWLVKNWVSMGAGFAPLQKVVNQHPAEWGLIGIALRGSVVLFDEELDGAYQDWIADDMRAAYLPIGDEVNQLFPPAAPTAHCLYNLTQAFMQLLPEGDEE